MQLFCAEAVVKTNSKLVPVEDHPFHSPAMVFFGGGKAGAEERGAGLALAVRREDENVFEEQCRPREERGVGVKINSIPDGDAVNEREKRFESLASSEGVVEKAFFRGACGRLEFLVFGESGNQGKKCLAIALRRAPHNWT